MKNSRTLLFAALLLLILGISVDVLFVNRPYRVVGTVPQSMETGFARDQAILFYLDRPLPAGQELRSPFTGVVYRKAGDPTDGTAATGTATILPGRKAIAFVASPPLKAGAFDTANYNYELDISYDTTGLHVSPYTISFSTVALFDTTGIWVQQASPEADAIGVSTDYHPFLIFNEPLDPATIHASNILLKDAAGRAIATAVSFDYSNDALSIVPSTTLQPGTVYIITASLGFKSMAGQTLQWPYVWQFTTRPASKPPDLTSPNPYVVSVRPSDFTTGVSVTSPITVIFSQPMDPTTLTSRTVHLRAYGQSIDLPTTLTYFPADNRLTIQPNRAMPASTVISLDLDAANIQSASDHPSDVASGVNTPAQFFTSPPDAPHPPPPAQIPSNTSPGLKEYLAAHDQLMRDEVTFMNQHQADDPITRQAALKLWRQQNAPRFQQLELQSHALSQSASTPTTVPATIIPQHATSATSPNAR